MARPRQRKLNDSDFKVWLLNNFIDDKGNKVSFTDLLNSGKLKEVGLHRINKDTGEDEPCSRGSLSYWCYHKKYGVSKVEPFKGEPISDEVIYKWGVQNGMINKDVVYDTWTNIHNRNGTNGTTRNISSDRILLDKIARQLKSGYRVKDLQGDVVEFRKFLVTYYGADKYYEALEKIGDV